ncbi:hypothetical protein RIVM261_007710 [Rivularia sp. IAM M-261]|nr:hypothetical protein RIVM261_007710 [Rivularia sp. IAM M-261]
MYQEDPNTKTNESVKKLLDAYQLGERNFTQVNLENADLSGVNLSGSNLRRAKLNKANLSGANLEKTDLQCAELKQANLNQANLKNAKLDAANLEAANLTQANLNGAYMAYAQLVQACLREARLCGSHLTGANLEQSILDKADLSNARLRKANLQQANLKQAYLVESNLTLSNLTNANLQKADLTKAKLDGAILVQADLREAEILEAININFESVILGKLQQRIEHSLHLELKGHAPSFTFSLDNETFAYCNYHENVTLINYLVGKSFLEIDIESEPVISVVFSDVGRCFYHFLYINELKLWNPLTGKLIKSLKHHSANLTSVVLDSKANTLGVTDTGEPFELFDVGHEKRTFKGYSSGIKTQAYSPDDKLIARSAPSLGKEIELTDRKSGKKICILTGHRAPVESLAFSSDSKLLVSASAKDTKVWEIETKKEVFDDNKSILQLRYYCAPKLAFISANNLKAHILLSSELFNEIQYRKATSIKRDDDQSDWRNYSGSSSASYFTISANRKVLLRQYSEQPIQLWNLETCEELGAVDLDCCPLALNYTGDILVVRHQEETQEILVWDVQAKKIKFNLVGHARFVCAVAFSPDSLILASGSWDNTLKIWNLQTGCEIQSINLYSNVESLVFNSTGKILVSGHRDGTVKFWDLTTLLEIYSFKAHQEDVEALEFSPDGKFLASSDENGIRLWKLKFDC